MSSINELAHWLIDSRGYARKPAFNYAKFMRKRFIKVKHIKSKIYSSKS